MHRFIVVLLGSLLLLAQAHADPRRSPSKPTAPVSLHADSVSVAAGDIGVIQLHLDVDRAVDRLRVRVGPSEGLDVHSIDVSSLSTMAAGEMLLVPVEFTALEDGRHYINVVAETRRGGLARMRAFAVPVNVGDGQRRMRSPGQHKTTPVGESVISLPAQETVDQAAAE